MFHLFRLLRWYNRAPSHGLYDEVTRDFRVGLADIDLNLHLNNAKYLKYMDLARLENLLCTGMMWRFFRERVNPIITNTEISYIRELRTWQAFSVSAQFLGFDDKYLYFEQRFMSDGKLCTHAFTRFACVHKGRAQPARPTLERLGAHAPSAELPEPVLAWKEMLEAKKHYALGKPRGPAENATETDKHVA